MEQSYLPVTGSDNTDRPAILENEKEIKSALPTYFQSAFDEASSRRQDLLKSLASSMPNAVLAVQTNSGTVYKAVNGIALQQTKDGLYSATLRNENGQIVKEVSLEKVSGAARAFSLAYSALNTVVGQMNMMSINRQLKSIVGFLEDAKDRDYIRLKAKVEAACIGLQKVSSLEHSDHQAQTILERQNDLLEALLSLTGYMKLEIARMPACAKTTFGKLFSNWYDSKKQTNDAETHFSYFLKAFQPWFIGMQWLILSDALWASATKCRSTSGFQDAFVNGLQEIVVDTGLADRVQFVPLYGDWDPSEFVQQIDVKKIKENFDGFAAIAAGSDPIKITINADEGVMQNV